jgi:hypothetical protein
LATPKDAAVIDIGGGASFLVDALAADGFGDLTVLDVSGAALHAVRQRLGPGQTVTLVHATVGLTTYDGSPGRSPRCGMLPPSASLPVGLHLVLQLKHNSVRSGAAFSATVIVDEHGPGRFTMDTGQPLVAVVVRPGTLQVVGVYSGGIAGTGYSLLLTPGKSGTITTLGGTARCDGGLGSALPPGTYQVIVRVAPEGRHQYPAYLTPPLTLRVTA